ncbi:MAG: hybrid sensor histidine kinase/response regulator [Burkholderiaceae bacterium]|nr:hybrid sensor histidine kinase/response regulator [Burkholderiaceae bacterium]
MADWFPFQHAEQVRIAQSVAMVPQLRRNAAFIICMMALGLAVQVEDGFSWADGVWQLIMGTLVFKAMVSWARLRELPPPERVSRRRIRNLVLSAGLCSTCWMVGLIAWAGRADPQLALMAVAVSMILVIHTASAGYFLPWGVVAFSVPMFAGSIFVSLSALQPPTSLVCTLLVVLHGIAAFRLLRSNWAQFSRAIDLDVQRDRLETILQEQKEIAEQAVQLKTRFLASASHDLRQPMHAITLYLDGLAEAELPERIRLVITDARVCAHDMIDMFRSLLDMSRLDTQQAVPALSVFSISSVLARVEKEFSPLATSRAVRLKVRPCGDHVYSDPVMVERIVLNFVSNAVRHTSDGRVLVGCRVRGRSLRVAVYDTGKGIPESKQQVIFDEFHRLDVSRPADQTGGLGLGLAIVRRLAQAPRLPVTVRSTPGRGSMFAVDLPLVHVARYRPDIPVAGARLSGRLVVVVDDEPAILRAASFMLETAGCEVIGARSGSDAMASLAGSVRVPDFIICDYELNDTRTGSDVIRDLREEFNSDIPALLVTGSTAGGRADKSAKELGVRVLYKPLEAAALKRSLEELLITEEP